MIKFGVIISMKDTRSLLCCGVCCWSTPASLNFLYLHLFAWFDISFSSYV